MPPSCESSVPPRLAGDRFQLIDQSRASADIQHGEAVEIALDITAGLLRFVDLQFGFKRRGFALKLVVLFVQGGGEFLRFGDLIFQLRDARSQIV